MKDTFYKEEVIFKEGRVPHTQRQLKHWQRHTFNWEHHYRKETRKRIGAVLFAVMFLLALAAILIK